MHFRSTVIAVMFAAANALAIHQRNLSQESIAGYTPRTQVTDHAAIDLDQKKIEERVGLGQFDHAYFVYSQGGNSKSFAKLTLINPVPNKSYKKGTHVMGKTDGNGGEGVTTGTLMEDVSWGEMPVDGTGQVVVKVQYTTSDSQSKYVDCQVGALFTFGEANHNGCFAENGSVDFVISPSQKDSYDYGYDIRRDNLNGRTIQDFSIDADETMRPGPGEHFFNDFDLFFAYYGDVDYADKWITAASNGGSTTFTSGRGDADFSSMVGTRGRGRAEAFKKGTLYLSIWMYVVREMEDAIADCRMACDMSNPGTCNDGPVHALDEAVAFYTGSMEGKDGSGDGNLLYDLADLRASEFRTAGYRSDHTEGTSYINREIFFWFREMQEALNSKNADGTGQCDDASIIKNTIVNLMKVPIIQSVLKFAYIRDMEDDPNAEQTEAEGATSIAALLPYLYDCSPAAAHLLYEEMKIGSDKDNVNFARLKSTLEDMYTCLGVTCTQVGGLWDGKGYAENASPCQDGWGLIDRTPSTGNDNGNGNTLTSPGYREPDSGESLVPIVVAILVVGMLTVAFLLVRSRRQSKKHLEGPVADMNIAAVSAVSNMDLT